MKKMNRKGLCLRNATRLGERASWLGWQARGWGLGDSLVGERCKEAIDTAKKKDGILMGKPLLFAIFVAGFYNIAINN